MNAIFGLAIQLSSDMERDEDELTEGDSPPELEEQMEYMQEAVNQDVDRDLTMSTIETLLTSSPEQLRVARDIVRNSVFEVMNEGISVDEVPEARDEAEERVLHSLNSSRLHDAVTEITRSLVIANYIYDDEATSEQVQLLLSEVDPVLIREGQLLAQEGEIIGPAAYEQMRLVGLLDENITPYPYIGLLIFTAVLLLMFRFYTVQTSSPIKHSNRHLLLYVIVFFIMLALMTLISLLSVLDVHGVIWITPIALGAMLLAQLLNYRIALFSVVLLSLCASVIYNGSAAGAFHSSFLVYSILSGFSGVFFIGKNPRTGKILQAGVYIALVNAAIVTVLHVFNNQQLVLSTFGFEITFAILSGFLSAVLTLGLLPFFETGFNILSQTKLIELTNANHPLLRKILLEAPGTYHHSVMVANLAEAACEAIGANGLLARVGAYYHDLGKTKKPVYFIENQLQMDNPHDRLPPKKSAALIIAHPYDGAKMLEAHQMPKEIVDIAKQHHGTTMLKYFYYKAKEIDESPKEEAYRYPGPKAQFKESAVIGIADSVEAAVRSMSEPSDAKIKALVDAIIQDRLVDQQLDECDITVRELAIVASSMCETLHGTFHSRIEYPDEEKESKSAQ
ncbi:HD family phosphohydrolase [Geomicrobium sp. JCM 19039]|uniref:HD family phosphohydrolase n=1 Tax=Geomicrobium sp. JCM 19039 TaxID=1460636 RepID=UPI001267DF92|nr:HDIG domain-containing metalloprotein [Geomicrobium sp. JCM 19039]